MNALGRGDYTYEAALVQKTTLENDLNPGYWKLQKSPRIGVRHWAICLAYSAIFPVTNMLGGSLLMPGIILTFPFLPLAYVGGMAVVALTQSDTFYQVGAFLTIFAQVFTIVFCFLARKEGKGQQA